MSSDLKSDRFAALLDADAADRSRADATLARLIAIMAALRDPEHGCPWDIKQTFETIAPYTIDEAYEVADAIERGDMADLKDELGDLLLQVVYHAQLAQERGLFAFADVANAVNDKLIRRHPHVFGQESLDAKAHSARWDDIKKAERAEKAAKSGGAAEPALFADVPANLPALSRATKLQKRAARIGFDWPSLQPVLEKAEEEWAELKAELEAGDSQAAQEARFEEFGDLMFVMVNLGRHLGIDAEAALRAANAKFVRRMTMMEMEAAESGSRLDGMTLEEMDRLWDNAKAKE